MPTPRKQLISLADTPNYHIVSRCVRRSWLCGKEPYNGKDYSYRRDWIIERLELLVTAFAIDISAYAILSNHTHLVLHINADQAKSWTREEVIKQFSNEDTHHFRWVSSFIRDGTLVDPPGRAASTPDESDARTADAGGLPTRG